MISRNMFFLYSVMVNLHYSIPTSILIPCGILKLVRYPFFSYSYSDPNPFHWKSNQSRNRVCKYSCKNLSQSDYESEQE